jgi:hypothetical protein
MPDLGTVWCFPSSCEWRTDVLEDLEWCKFQT